MKRFRKQINNLIIRDISPKYWRACAYGVFAPDGRFLEQFNSAKTSEQNKQNAINYAKSIKDFIKK